VPLASLGDQFGVDTPTIKSMIRLAGAAHGTDFFESGRTTKDMGLDGLSVRQIKHFVETGKMPKNRGGARK
jgi:opine dehydrogenase